MSVIILHTTSKAWHDRQHSCSLIGRGQDQTGFVLPAEQICANQSKKKKEEKNIKGSEILRSGEEEFEPLTTPNTSL